MNSSSAPKTKIDKIAILLAIAWWWLAILLHGRDHFLLNYGSLRAVPAALEPFVSSYSINAIAIGLMGLWITLFQQANANAQSSHNNGNHAKILMAVALVPIVPWLLDVLGVKPPFSAATGNVQDGWVSLSSVYWFVAWSGASFAKLGQSANRNSIERTDSITISLSQAQETTWSLVGVTAVSFLVAAWWVMQSYHYYDSFMLGFNDFGHFMQRVSNTSNGNGVLLETPVLPMFWDHFNPGLLLLVPVWKLYPDVTLAFYLQAGALALSSIAVWFVARGAAYSARASACWSLAWLSQPILGQMNLAYTYSWHPISLAIPLLIVSIAFLQRRRMVLTTISTLLALSMEEGVFVIVATFCFVNMILSTRRMGGTFSGAVTQLPDVLSWRTWGICSLVSLIGFVLVFKYSGLAEFQTSRFASLGSSPLEIIAAPIARPTVFWSQLISGRNAYFVLGLSIPCFLPNMVRGWRFLLAVLPPLGVLLVWEHKPAASMAFQYSSILLPVLWFASMTVERGGPDSGVVERDAKSATKRTGIFSFDRSQAAVGALATAFLFSLYLGQFPFSSQTLSDVRASTYASGFNETSSDEFGNQQFPRDMRTPDGDWIHGRLKTIQGSGQEVLATGRIASHLLGNREIETVGQYILRREKLAKLPNWPPEPIRHYQWLIVDRFETFQQTAEQTAEIEQEALAHGFTKVEERFGVAIYRNAASF